MPQKITVADMVRAIHQAEKPVTAREIAEACGVTRQTISNYRDDLEEDPRVEHGQVGTATAYWIPEAVEDEGDGPRAGGMANEEGAEQSEELFNESETRRDEPSPDVESEDSIDGRETPPDDPADDVKTVLSVIRRLFTGGGDGPALPSVALLLLATVLPLLALRYVLDRAIERLTGAAEVYKEGATGLGREITVLAAIAGLATGVALNVVFLNPLPTALGIAVSFLVAVAAFVAVEVVGLYINARRAIGGEAA